MPFLAFGKTCLFEKSIYQDLDGGGFRLEFAPPKADEAPALHSATVTHPKRGTVFEFDFAYGMGYGQPVLRTRDRDGSDGSAFDSLGIHFFDENLRSTDLDELAPPMPL